VAASRGAIVTLAATGGPAGALTLEITESSLFGERPAGHSVLDHLAQIGVRLSIDDFGTGYSSLSRLARLPVQEVKIDKSFVLDRASNGNGAVIVRSTIALGHNLGMQVVAEGERAALERLVEALRVGPPAAMVESVNAEWSAPTGEFHRFEVATQYSRRIN